MLVKLVEHKAREVSDFRSECFDRFMTGTRNLEFLNFRKNVTLLLSVVLVHLLLTIDLIKVCFHDSFFVKLRKLKAFRKEKEKEKKRIEQRLADRISILPLDRYKLIHHSEWDDECYLYSKKIFKVFFTEIRYDK